VANNKAHDELKLLYQVSVGDLEFFKKQQWLVSYYSILLYGALVALAQRTAVEKIVFYLVIGGVALLSSSLLLILEHSIGVRRERLEAVREHFSKEFNKAWRAGKKLSECHIVVAFMLFTVFGGAVLAILGIIFKANAT